MLRYFKYRTPFKKPFKTSLGLFTHREGIILVYKENEIQAFGEVAPLPGFSSESLTQVETVLIQNKKFLVGGFKDGNAEQVINVLDQIHEFPSLSYGLDTLQHDLKAKKQYKSLSTLLFNKEASPIICNTTVGIQSKKETITALINKLSKGFSTVKIKVGSDFNSEKEILEEIRKEFPLVKIRIDANQAWNEKSAIKNLQGFSKYNIEYCEQPVTANDIQALKKVTHSSDIKIAADESLGNKMRAKQLIEQNCCDLIIIKPALIGLFNTINVTKQLAETHDMEVVFTTLLDGIIGRKTSAILASGLGSKKYAHGLATGSLLSEQNVSNNIEQGAYHFSNFDGIGVSIDLTLLQEIT
ncbi:MAG: dipeptide epimerase [Balneolaceae bacterium]